MECETLDQVLKLVEANDILWFVGKETQGISWCGDCNRTSPTIAEALKGRKYVKIQVDRQVHRNPQNDFRSHPKIALKCVPTLLKYSTGQRLEEDETLNKANLLKFLE